MRLDVKGKSLIESIRLILLKTLIQEYSSKNSHYFLILITVENSFYLCARIHDEEYCSTEILAKRIPTNMQKEEQIYDAEIQNNCICVSEGANSFAENAVA